MTTLTCYPYLHKVKPLGCEFKLLERDWFWDCNCNCAWDSSMGLFGWIMLLLSKGTWNTLFYSIFYISLYIMLLHIDTSFGNKKMCAFCKIIRLFKCVILKNQHSICSLLRVVWAHVFKGGAYELFLWVFSWGLFHICTNQWRSFI